MQWTEANALITAASRIIIVTHIFPDGDAIGSLMGLTHALRSIGKEVTPVVDGGTPDYLQFIPGSDVVRSDLNEITADLAITVDASDMGRTGEAGKQAFALGVPVIMLDHHPTNLLFGTINLLNPTAPAAAEIVLDWLDSLNISLTHDAAFALLTGIVTDTLCFRVSSVTSDTLEKAHRLMAAGAPLSEITQRTVSRRAPGVFALWASVMPTVQIEEHVIWAVLDRAARESAHYKEDGDGGLVGLMIEAAEAYISATFRETKDGKVDLGFRAIPGFNVAQVALSLGGGGHIQAAGATVEGSLADVVARVVPLLKEAARVGSPVIV